MTLSEVIAGSEDAGEVCAVTAEAPAKKAQANSTRMPQKYFMLYLGLSH
jgi:hypothetical protein